MFGFAPMTFMAAVAAAFLFPPFVGETGDGCMDGRAQDRTGRGIFGGIHVAAYPRPDARDIGCLPAAGVGPTDDGA